MITGIFHSGSGLGNQLFRYVATRVLALDKGYECGMLGVEDFKGVSFMKIDMGKEPIMYSGETMRCWFEKKVEENGVDIRSYDPEINFVKDGFYIDGEFQDPRYFEHRLPEIREWLKIKSPISYPDIASDVCVINFRGGEYVGISDLFLPQSYWDEAIALMKKKHPHLTRFVVHTDDEQTAREFFPDFEIVQDMERNWKAIRKASYLIISNSSFAILPALLNELAQTIIAPKFWAGHNKGFWQLPQNYYKQFTYI